MVRTTAHFAVELVVSAFVYLAVGRDSLTLSYADPAHKHAVSATTGTQTLALAYDANGNLSTQGTSQYTYDAENRLTSRTATGGVETYAYDADGNMVMKTDPTGIRTYRIGGVYEERTDGAKDEYFVAFGQPVAERKIQPSNPTGVILYMFHDQIGSLTGTSNDQNSWYTGVKYFPYGTARLGGFANTDQEFTGQWIERNDSALNLYDYGARFYSTTLGRFVSADPVVGSPGEPASWNPYSYVRNNPLIHTDPTGKCLPDMEGPHGCGFDPHPYDVTDYQRESYSGANPIGQINALDASIGLRALANSGIPSWLWIAASESSDASEFLNDVLGGGVEPCPLCDDVFATGASLVPGLLGAGVDVVAVGGRSIIGRLGADELLSLVSESGSVTLGDGTTITASEVAERTGLALSDHALLRMAQRSIGSEEVIGIVEGGARFDYLHEGVWKVGYYDPVRRVLVATEGGRVNSVIDGVGYRYVQNLIKNSGYY